MVDGKIRDLVAQAQSLLRRTADDPKSLWRAYVAVEYAILDIKLRHGLEHELSPPTPKRTAKREDLLSIATTKLARIALEANGGNDDDDKENRSRKKLLYELRECRDALKALLAKSKP
jgi:hypothetical protein